MDGRIAHLSGHYRVCGAQVAVPGLVSRLDRVMRQDLRESYEEALHQALADDESVYVLRRVDASLTLILGEGATDTALARTWGANLAGAVLRAIAEAEHDTSNLVRFENHADYVAHFLVTLLKGNQGGQWVYLAFADLSSLDRESAISRALLDNREHFPAILSYVYRYGELDSLISALDVRTMRALWSAEAEQHHNPEAARSLFLVALQFVDGLESWARIPRDGEDLFRDYLETATTAADWQDPRSLACSVFEVIRFLLLRGYVVRRESGTADFHARLNKTLQRFAWLDREWLRSALVELFDTNEQRAADLPVPVMARRATPRQRELISIIGDLLADSRVIDTAGPSDVIERADPLGVIDTADPIAAALKILALLVTEQPRWADDAGARVMIQNLLATQAAMRDASAPGEFVRLLRCRDVEGALRLLPKERREQARDPCRFISRLGGPAVAVVERLSSQSQTQQPATANYVDSNCAGMSLLIRTVLDARWHALPEDRRHFPTGEWPHPVMLFLLVALRLGGEAAVVNGFLDEGLNLIAGLEDPGSWETLRSHCSDAKTEELARFQNALLEIAAGHRLFGPATMNVFEAEVGDGKRALFAGDAQANLWLFARLFETEAEACSTVVDWQTGWEEATGTKPRVVADGAVLAMLLRDGPGDAAPPDNEEMQALHVNCQMALPAALEALEHGRMGQADLDLSVFIAACMLLRMWARWLRGFSSAGVGFLTKNFIRRHGRLLAQRDGLVVELDRGPLDIVIEMAGCLDDLEGVPWLPGGGVRFQLKGA